MCFWPWNTQLPGTTGILGAGELTGEPGHTGKEFTIISLWIHCLSQKSCQVYAKYWGHQNEEICSLSSGNSHYTAQGQNHMVRHLNFKWKNMSMIWGCRVWSLRVWISLPHPEDNRHVRRPVCIDKHVALGRLRKVMVSGNLWSSHFRLGDWDNRESPLLSRTPQSLRNEFGDQTPKSNKLINQSTTFLLHLGWFIEQNFKNTPFSLKVETETPSRNLIQLKVVRSLFKKSNVYVCEPCTRSSF